MKKRLLSLLLAAVMVLSMLPGMAFAASTTNEQPFPQGTLGSTNFRIPAIVTLDNGTLVAAADARWSTSNDGGGIDTMIAISRDNGATWDHTWGAYLGNNANTGKTDSSYGTFIDPALATDGKTVYLLVDLFPRGHSNLSTGLRGDAFTSEGYLRLCANKSESETDYTYYLGSFDSNADETAQRAKIFDSSNNAVSGYTVDRWFNLYTVDETGAETKVSNLFYSDAAYWAYPINYLYLTKSTDGGATWSAPSLLDFKENGEIFYGVCPGGATVTADGTIIFPCYGCEVIGSNLRASYIYSTDGGNTWARSWSRSTQTFANKSSEASITQAKVGDKTYLYAFMRYYPTNTSGAYYVSEDNGNTWKAMTDVTYSCGGALGTVTYSKTINGKPAILVSSPSSTSNANGRIYVFTVNGDGSLKNEFTYVVNNSYYKYSDMTELSDGSIGLLYESAGAAITFAKLDIATIAPGATIGGSDTTDPDQPDIPVEPEDTTVTDAATGVTVTAPGLTSVTVKDVAAPEIACAEPGKVVAHDITPVTGTGNYIGEATVTFARPDDWTDSNRIQGFVMKDGLLEKMDTSVNGDKVSVKFEHFSVGGIYYAADATAETPVEEITITISVGETKTATIPNENYGNGNNVNRDDLDTDVATVEVKGNDASNTPNKATTLTSGGTYIIGDGANWLKWNGATLSNTTDPADATKWTITQSGTSYTIKSGSYYLRHNSSTLSADTNANQNTWNYDSSSGFYYNYTQRRTTYYLCYNSGWSVGTANSNGYAYSYDPVPASTTVTITGVYPGETSVTVGNYKYNITVKKAEVTISVKVGDTRIIDGYKFTGYPNETFAQTGTNENGKLTITGVATGTTTAETDTTKYTINVVDTPTSTGNHVLTSALPVNDVILAGDPVTGLMLSYYEAGDTIISQTFFVVTSTDDVNSWESTDDAIATVDGNGKITAKGVGECYVIATFSDGTTTVIPVRVIQGNTKSNAKNKRHFTIYIDATYHSELYVTVASGAAKDESWMKLSEGYVINAELDSANNSAFVFATKHDDGYATTCIGQTTNITENNLVPGTYSYIGRETKDDGTVTWASDTSNVNSDGPVYFYDYAQTKNLAGDSNVYTLSEFEKLLQNGIDTFDLDAGFYYTQTLEKNTGYNIRFQIVSDKLPTFEKKIVGVTKKGEAGQTLYSDGMSIDLGDTIHYQITVTTYKPHSVTYTSNNPYDAITYSNATWSDELTEVTREKIDLVDSTDSAGTIKAVPGEVVQNTTPVETSFTLSMENFDQVKDGMLTNTATLNYTYDAQYSRGTATASADASAECKITTPTYVVDFGLPVEIDLSTVLGEVEISNANSSCSAQCAPNGTKLTYKPISTIAAQGDYVSLDLDNGQHYGVTILPASNVLYEEDFMEMETSGTDVSWEKFGTPVNATQSSENAACYGYDVAYKESTGALGVWKAGSTENHLTSSTSTGALTTTFYGNGFDLIGNAGPDTGRILLLIQGEGRAYLYTIDTRYSDSLGTTLTQVPLAHAELDKEGTYTVKIIASGLDATTASSTVAAAYAMNSSYDAVLESFLAENGLSIYDVEYISLQSTLGSSSVMMTADTATTGTVDHAAGTHVEIDSFRVYRSAANTNYPTAEQNVSYVNILDAVQGEITAYTEAEGEITISPTLYEGSGGPQNEIYLASDSETAVQIHLIGVNIPKKIQVSLRAVNGPTNWNSNSISSNTEMYYEVDVVNSIATIANTGSNMLAIGNVKLPDGVMITAPSNAEPTAMVYSLRMALSAEPAAPETPAEPEVPAYEPFVKVNVKSVNVIRNKLVTLTITTSTDVETLTVNGKTLKPTNSWMVKMGWSNTYTYVHVDTVRRGTTADYEIIATNSDGLSCTYSAQG